MGSPLKLSPRKNNFLTKKWSRSFPTSDKKKVAPEGFFPVYVGPEKQWFAVKTKNANHPLFLMLLEDAQIEYGYNTPGPILLPCEVDLFCRVLAEMEDNEMEPRGCGFGYGLRSLFSPGRRLANTGNGQMGEGYGSFGILQASPRLVKH